MTRRESPLGGFAVRGVIWRKYLDWAAINLPFYFYPVNIFFFTLFFFFFAAPARRALVANLSIVLPGSSRAMNHWRAFRILSNFAWTISEAAVSKLIKEEFAYEIVGPDWLDQLGAAPSAIVLTAHMGSYDLGAALFAEKFNREIRMVRAPEPDRETAKHLSASLEQAGEGAVKVDYNTAGALLSFDLLSALRGGEIVSIQGDRAEGHVAQVSGTLFGRKVWLPNGPFVLALVAGVPIYPLFIARLGHRSYQIVVREPINVVRTGRTREEEIAEAVVKWCGVLEEMVARSWDQWFAFGPVFPGDEPTGAGTPSCRRDYASLHPAVQGRAGSRFYFALFRLLALLRGGDARRSESNAVEATVAGAAVYLVSYLFFTRFIPNDLTLWLGALLFVSVFVVVCLAWLVVLYLNSLIIKFLRGVRVFQSTPLRRAQSILLGLWTSAMACDLLRRGSWMAEIAAIWLIAVAMNLIAAAVLAFRHEGHDRGK